jgi:hypothetical protein
MVHPASGVFHWGTIATGTRLSHAVLLQFNLKQHLPMKLLEAGWKGLWPDDCLRDLYRFGLEKLMRFDEALIFFGNIFCRQENPAVGRDFYLID